MVCRVKQSTTGLYESRVTGPAEGRCRRYKQTARIRKEEEEVENPKNENGWWVRRRNVWLGEVAVNRPPIPPLQGTQILMERAGRTSFSIQANLTSSKR